MNSNTATQQIKPGALVATDRRKLNGLCVEVLPDIVLKQDTLTDDLVNDGWQLAAYPTGFRVLVRLMNETMWIGKYNVRKVEIADIETVCEEVPDHLRAIPSHDNRGTEYAICVGLGDARQLGWTHLESVADRDAIA